jgi:hypothetical protein
MIILCIPYAILTDFEQRMNLGSLKGSGMQHAKALREDRDLFAELMALRKAVRERSTGVQVDTITVLIKVIFAIGLFCVAAAVLALLFRSL